jgi:hypothetical protein
MTTPSRSSRLCCRRKHRPVATIDRGLMRSVRFPFARRVLRHIATAQAVIAVSFSNRRAGVSLHGRTETARCTVECLDDSRRNGTGRSMRDTESKGVCVAIRVILRINYDRRCIGAGGAVCSPTVAPFPSRRRAMTATPSHSLHRFRFGLPRAAVEFTPMVKKPGRRAIAITPIDGQLAFFLVVLRSDRPQAVHGRARLSLARPNKLWMAR